MIYSRNNWFNLFQSRIEELLHIRLPWVVRLYVEIIHKRTSGQTWFNYLHIYISVDLAHLKIVCANVGKGGVHVLIGKNRIWRVTLRYIW